MKTYIKLWIVSTILIVLFGLKILYHLGYLHNTDILPKESPKSSEQKAKDQFMEQYLDRLSRHNEILKNQDSNFTLASSFKKADSNVDGYLDAAELISWIVKKIKSHLTQALKDNIFVFTAIDKYPRNGVISWEEYIRYFLKQNGYKETFIEKHISTLHGMTREMKEAVMREKAAWSEAASDDPSKLSLTEFLAFKHPEASHTSVVFRVEEELVRLDVDGNDILTEEEFSDVNRNYVPSGMTQKEVVEERVKLFREMIDTNANGKAEKSELIDFFSPSNIHYAESEAKNLIKLADSNSDERLSFREVLSHKNEFMKSKMIDVAISFHDDF